MDATFDSWPVASGSTGKRFFLHDVNVKFVMRPKYTVMAVRVRSIPIMERKLPTVVYIAIAGRGANAYLSADDEVGNLCEKGEKIRLGVYKLVELVDVEQKSIITVVKSRMLKQ